MSDDPTYTPDECPRCMVRQGSWYSASSRVPSDSPSPSSSFRDDGILLARKRTVPFVFVSAQPYRTSSLGDIRTSRNNCYSGISRHRYGRRSQYSECGSRQGSTRRKGSVHSEGRRSSVRSNRSRRNSCAFERNKATSRSRKMSVKLPVPVPAATAVLPPKPYVIADVPYEDEDRARRHRIAVWLVLGSFIFIAVSSILIVVVTLTHQSELNFDENNTLKYYTFAVPSKLKPYIDSVRKENEELMNSLNRDSSGYNMSSVQASPP